MDSLTQLVLGAAVGYAVAGKEMGKKSMVWGALAGTIPDLDFIPILPLKDNFSYLKHHRGFSHSLIFTVLGTLLITWMVKPFLSRKTTRLTGWIFFWGVLTHIVLDCFTSWGTQVFWPISDRVAWNAIFIIDPLYTLPLLFSLLIALFVKSQATQQKWIKFGLTISSFYLVLALGIKVKIHQSFQSLFHTKNIEVTRMMTRPSPFNLILWSASAETEEGYYYAMVSLFDQTKNQPVYFLKKNHQIPQPFHTKQVQELLKYTKEFYTVENNKNELIIHDLRYGYLGDPWKNGGNFVFSYVLTKDKSEKMKLEIKNPRPKETKKQMAQLWGRIKGI